MKMQAIFFFAMVAVATCKPSAIIAPYAAVVDTTEIVKGPVTSSVVTGPDGSSISSVADSGAVVAPKAALIPGIAPAAYLAAPSAIAYATGPAVYAPVPLPAAVVSPVASGTVIEGPSGRISTTNTHLGYVAGPVFRGIW